MNTWKTPVLSSMQFESEFSRKFAITLASKLCVDWLTKNLTPDIQPISVEASFARRYFPAFRLHVHCDWLVRLSCFVVICEKNYSEFDQKLV